MAQFSSKSSVVSHKKITSNVIALLVAGTVFTGCVPRVSVQFESNVPGASVMVDGEKIGETPCKKRMSNFLAKDPEIVLTKEGYNDLHTELHKKAVGSNIVIGATVNTFALLWCYGPKKVQHYDLIPLKPVQ